MAPILSTAKVITFQVESAPDWPIGLPDFSLWDSAYISRSAEGEKPFQKLSECQSLVSHRCYGIAAEIVKPSFKGRIPGIVAVLELGSIAI